MSVCSSALRTSTAGCGCLSTDSIVPEGVELVEAVRAREAVAEAHAEQRPPTVMTGTPCGRKRTVGTTPRGNFNRAACRRHYDRDDASDDSGTPARLLRRYLGACDERSRMTKIRDAIQQTFSRLAGFWAKRVA